MSEQIAETPKEELQCKNKYLYEYAMFWECNDGFKSQILDSDVADLLNEQQATISQLEEEKGYWKNKAMTLLMQVRRLTPRMTDKEVREFSKELDDE